MGSGNGKDHACFPIGGRWVFPLARFSLSQRWRPYCFLCFPFSLFLRLTSPNHPGIINYLITAIENQWRNIEREKRKIFLWAIKNPSSGFVEKFRALYKIYWTFHIFHLSFRSCSFHFLKKDVWRTLWGPQTKVQFECLEENLPALQNRLIEEFSTCLFSFHLYATALQVKSGCAPVKPLTHNS